MLYIFLTETSLRLLPIFMLLALPAIAFADPEIIISLKEQHLYLVDQGVVIADYPVGIGKPSTPTPPGSYKISDITANPTWTVPESIMTGPNPPRAKRIPPGRGNPLGDYFLRLSGSSYGIHGTTAPRTVPGSVSAGCVRMRNQDVSVLAELVEKGTSVRIIVESYKEAEPQDIETDISVGETSAVSVPQSAWLTNLAR